MFFILVKVGKVETQLNLQKSRNHIVLSLTKIFIAIVYIFIKTLKI